MISATGKVNRSGQTLISEPDSQQKAFFGDFLILYRVEAGRRGSGVKDTACYYCAMVIICTLQI